MPRYIKDGVYKILDVDHLDDDSEDDAGSIAAESNNENASEKQRQKDLRNNFEEVDFASSKFILQNLSIATPSITDDTQFNLRGRKDNTEMIIHEVCFYVFCALRAFRSITRLSQVSILVMGDGFIGSHIIYELEKCGCGPMLRIFSRGDVSAGEWAEQGFLADCSIFRLLQGVRPDIIIMNIELSNILQTCHLLVTNNILSESSFVIATSFGFQRRKMYNIMKVPTILRSYVEPQDLLRKLQNQLREDLATKANGAIVEMAAGASEAADSPSRLAAGQPKQKQSSRVNSEEPSTPQNPMTPFNDSGALQHHRHLGGSFYSARVMLTRMGNSLISFVRLLENYYVIKDIPPYEARLLALEAICDFDVSLVPAHLHTLRPSTPAVTSPLAVGEAGMLGTDHHPSLFPPLISGTPQFIPPPIVIGKTTTVASRYCKYLQQVFDIFHVLVVRQFREVWSSVISPEQLHELEREKRQELIASIAVSESTAAAEQKEAAEQAAASAAHDSHARRRSRSGAASISAGTTTVDEHGRHLRVTRPVTPVAVKAPRPPTLSADDLCAIYDEDDAYEGYIGRGFEYMARLDGQDAHNRSRKQKDNKKFGRRRERRDAEESSPSSPVVRDDGEEISDLDDDIDSIALSSIIAANEAVMKISSLVSPKAKKS
jgi:hypothetical protein